MKGEDGTPVDFPCSGCDPLGHLIPGPDPRTPEQRAEAQRKENARRKGRGRKDWWKKYPPADLR
ncbi:hypothetical protein GCM10027564_27940 [Luteimonas notoginsengisoli]